MTNHKLDTDEAIYFYEQDYYVFSNFSSFSISWQGLGGWGKRFPTSEHVYQWEKFNTLPALRTHEHMVLQYKIRNAYSAHEAFTLARANKLLVHPDWDNMKIGVMERILRAKVDQHPYVLKKLLDSGSRLLVEDSYRDSFWGWGEDHKGSNVLGKLWMKLRDEKQIDLGIYEETYGNVL